jgi:rubrerythrin
VYYNIYKQKDKGEISLFNIEDLLSGDFSAYPEEAQVYVQSFSKMLRERLIEQLINDTAEKIFKSIEGGREEYKTILTEILENGHKGYKKMSTRALLNLYLEKKNEEEFIKLLEKVSSELE